MKCLLSQIPGAKIILFQENMLIGKVNDVLISPENGAVVGLEFISEKRKKYLPFTEIRNLTPTIVIAKDFSSISEAEDVVLIKKTLEQKPKIIGARVFNTKGNRIGKVRDAVINTEIGSLEKIYVIPNRIIKAFANDLTIPLEKIYKIEKNRIVIKDDNTKKVTQEAQEAIPVLAE